MGEKNICEIDLYCKCRFLGKNSKIMDNDDKEEAERILQFLKIIS